MTLALGLIIIVGIPIYFIPTMIAFSRGHAYRWIILVLNLFLPGLGWIIGLIWAIFPGEKTLADPLIGNTTGIGARNAGDVIGEAKYGVERGYKQERVDFETAPKGYAQSEADSAPVASEYVEPAQQIKALSQLRATGRISNEEFARLLNCVVTGNEKQKAVYAIQQLISLSPLLDENGLTEDEFRQTKRALLREIPAAPSELKENTAPRKSSGGLKYAVLSSLVIALLLVPGFIYWQSISAFIGSVLVAAGPRSAPRGPTIDASRAPAPNQEAGTPTTAGTSPAMPEPGKYHREKPAGDLELTREGGSWRVAIVSSSFATDSMQAGADCIIQAVGQLKDDHLIAHPVPFKSDVVEVTPDDVRDLDAVDITLGNGAVVVNSAQTPQYCGQNQDLTGTYALAK